MFSIIPDEQFHGYVEGFLGKFVDTPESKSIKTALSNLVRVVAFKQGKKFVGPLVKGIRLTALGKHLSDLPVDVSIGKFLMYGIMFGSFYADMIMAATVSEKSPFSRLLTV